MRDALKQYDSDFSRLKAIPQPLWLQKIRQAAFRRFGELGFPTTDQEAWRFTNVEPIALTPFQSAPPYHPNGLTPEKLDPLTCWSFGSPRLVFVDGQFAPELSSLKELTNGLVISPLSTALSTHGPLLERHLNQYVSSEHPFVALNSSFLTEGAFIHLSPGVHFEKPIQIICYSKKSDHRTVTHPRHLIVLEERAHATVVETYLGKGHYFTNAVTEVFSGENSFLDHYKLQREGREAFHVGLLQSYQERGGCFVSHSLSLGGLLTRNEINALLAREGAECVLDGLYVADQQQQIDNQTCIDHAEPHGTSGELYKGILKGNSKAVFNGRIVVRANAQKTRAKQSNKNLLLSDDAQINTRPLLEIHADDVKCNHGATVGRLDENQVFYLKSRGISEPLARGLLTTAFANEIVDRIKINPLKAFLNHYLMEHLEQQADV
ncbi:MAG: Fe-S cluster assembly protein SufD [Deltaproteobacteria bacterium]|nr:Fe-S cluster assembly protein SufD [Deltaproteobacteria bacterium]